MKKDNLITVEVKDEIIENSSNHLMGDSPTLKLKKNMRNR
jgi:hypothetical protein